MGTRSRLKIHEKLTSAKPIYCHWDGNPSNMLPLLNSNYNTIRKAKELLALGNLSYLGKRIKPKANEVHTFNNPKHDITCAYHRDRGEDLEFWGDPQQYNYLFTGDEWILDPGEH